MKSFLWGCKMIITLNKLNKNWLWIAEILINGTTYLNLYILSINRLTVSRYVWASGHLCWLCRLYDFYNLDRHFSYPAKHRSAQLMPQMVTYPSPIWASLFCCFASSSCFFASHRTQHYFPHAIFEFGLLKLGQWSCLRTVSVSVS